ncbi:hypothetical protein DRO02_04975 [archaeon]|nr:MAG: hypothetical protein DRO21_06475 [archaeon]RLG64200.1 MAG: hypothetical protein DRO02_04975 [archaeon]HDM23996.1 DUF362 domain-containing protein [Candidatus Bathyarchaeota archaeon]
MPSKVFFSRAVLEEYSKEKTLLSKLPKLLLEAGIEDIIEEGNIVAIKIHFGVEGGFRNIRPIFVKKIVDTVKDAGGNPFLTDTWGFRHVLDAYTHGFSYSTVGAPIIPANGIKENDFRVVKIKGLRLREVQVAGNIYDADVLINFSHCKGHASTAYGGAIKNLAMGCTSYKTRGEIHALENIDPSGVAIQEALADAVKAVLSNKHRKVMHVNYVMDVMEHCDCAPYTATPIVPDIGVMVSRDVVAIDQASLEMIDSAPPLPHPLTEKHGLKPGTNKFKLIHGKDPYVQVIAAEKLGLGSRRYELVEI